MPKFPPIDLNQILGAAMVLIAQYKRGRDQVQAAADPTDPTTGALKTDAELITMLDNDAAALQTKAEDLLAKFGATPPRQ